MTATTHSLPRIMIEPVVRAALLEDLGRSGDITSQAVVPAGTPAHLQLVARESGVLAGIEVAKLAFMLMDENCRFHVLCEDGADLHAGTVIADIQGDARAMLTAERTALNFLGHLSGIASATRPIAQAIAPYGTTVSCTRKTLPGMRMLQKYAVRVGGGSNHRFGLDDAVLIKDNHVAIAGGVRSALTRAKESVGHLVKIELEVDTLEQLDEALQCGVDMVLLDNMPIPMLKEAVQRIDGRAISEASGGITPESAIAVAQTGVNQIAMGWLTHSVRVLDIGLDSV
ncbi:carboxylating nicotinate-nucleotide diphosphorylase [Paenalcaligenes sp. Me131]|uniref:carboxylating nicotinate-nucleotide diphosphorylase n=1 Tax=Paenalcaligenes sp. Me131 TaxID=3392636 RepID=UPI003D29ADF6